MRNATQRELTATLGTVGATHVRFLFGFPFALVFLAGVLLATGAALPRPPPVFWPWVLDGALAQIAATALMLAAMSDRSFVVAIAYIKTEPVQVALFGLVFLGDAVTPPMAAAILIATAGVVVMSLKPGTGAGRRSRPTLLGLAAGAMFALSAIGYRGAILSLDAAELRDGRDLHDGVGLVVQVGAAVGLSRAARSRRACARSARLAAVAVRRLPGRARVAVLVPGLCARDRGERAHAGAGRGAVRAGDLAFVFKQPTTRARSARHRADRVGVGLLVWAH